MAESPQNLVPSQHAGLMFQALFDPRLGNPLLILEGHNPAQQELRGRRRILLCFGSLAETPFSEVRRLEGEEQAGVYLVCELCSSKT